LSAVSRTIFAFNGDLESCLALHWLVHERGQEVVALSLDLGQERYLEPLGERALELGARSALIVDCREEFLRDFAIPVLQADAVYQDGCFLGAALGRFVVARELIRAAHEHGCRCVAHSSATRGNDQLRLEAALAALAPDLEVVAPLRLWNLRTRADLMAYARRRHLLLDEPPPRPLTIDRNLWGISAYLDDLTDSWQEPPPEVFTLTRSVDQAPDVAVERTIGLEAGVPRSLDGQTLDLVPLVRELNEQAGLHGIGRRDVIEDRLFGIKVREFYEAPAATVLRIAHRDLEALVHSRELREQKEALARHYAALVYAGHWFHDLRRALQAFVAETQGAVSGEVRLRFSKGTCQIVGRRSPNSLYDGRLASQASSSQCDSLWSEAFSALWCLPGRLAAQRRKDVNPDADLAT
jgi:argininosuccinate synthase